MTTRTMRCALPLICALLLALPAAAAKFDDRQALIEILVLDEQAPLADAEETLEMAEEDLAAAELVLRWMFREEAGDPTSAEGNAKTTTAQG